MNTGAAARAAIEAYDSSGDGLLDLDELGNCPSLRAAMGEFDTDNSQTLSEAEISTRIASYAAEGIGAQSVLVTITQRGRPLADATVTLEPEEFLGSEFKSASGTTARDGSTAPVLQDSNLPGVQLGLYRVKISKREGDRETIPDRYNSKTELSHELTTSPDSFNANFDLKSP